MTPKNGILIITLSKFTNMEFYYHRFNLIVTKRIVIFENQWSGGGILSFIATFRTKKKVARIKNQLNDVVFHIR